MYTLWDTGRRGGKDNKQSSSTDISINKLATKQQRGRADIDPDTHLAWHLFHFESRGRLTLCATSVVAATQRAESIRGEPVSVSHRAHPAVSVFLWGAFCLLVFTGSIELDSRAFPLFWSELVGGTLRRSGVRLVCVWNDVCVSCIYSITPLQVFQV